MIIKLIFFTLAQYIPLLIWLHLIKKKAILVDWRLVFSYFIFGSWFGMYGELFLFKLIEWVFHSPIWEYRTLPIHQGKTSSYGPIMWGMAAVYVCFHKHYQINQHKKTSPFISFLSESSFLLILEIFFNLMAYFLFNDYFFYYFVPDLWHWSSFTNMPFWWIGYHMMVKYAKVLYKEEKLNISIAIMLIIIAYSYQ